MHDDGLSSLDFFGAAVSGYGQAMRAWQGRPQLVDTVLALAWALFDANVAVQSEELPALDCHKGCATCCTLRVTATAPEVFMVARFIRAVEPSLATRGVSLQAQVDRADEATRSQGEAERVALRCRCPFIARGVCVVYAVRPLACRGLASHDRKACAQAAAGRADAIPYSEPHMRMRSLVQNALQSALRQHGMAWASYELNQALRMALDDPSLEQQWLDGGDVLRAARVHEVDEAEMAATFDEISRLLS